MSGLESGQNTRALPKCPKMAVEEIGHVHEYAYAMQHTDDKMHHFIFPFEMRHFGIGIHIHASGLSLPLSFWGILAALA